MLERIEQKFDRCRYFRGPQHVFKSGVHCYLLSTEGAARVTTDARSFAV